MFCKTSTAFVLLCTNVFWLTYAIPSIVIENEDADIEPSIQYDVNSNRKKLERVIELLNNGDRTNEQPELEPVVDILDGIDVRDPEEVKSAMQHVQKNYDYKEMADAADEVRIHVIENPEVLKDFVQELDRKDWKLPTEPLSLRSLLRRYGDIRSFKVKSEETYGNKREKKSKIDDYDQTTRYERKDRYQKYDSREKFRNKPKYNAGNIRDITDYNPKDKYNNRDNFNTKDKFNARDDDYRKDKYNPSDNYYLKDKYNDRYNDYGKDKYNTRDNDYGKYKDNLKNNYNAKDKYNNRVNDNGKDKYNSRDGFNTKDKFNTRDIDSEKDKYNSRDKYDVRNKNDGIDKYKSSLKLSEIQNRVRDDAANLYQTANDFKKSIVALNLDKSIEKKPKSDNFFNSKATTKDWLDYEGRMKKNKLKETNNWEKPVIRVPQVKKMLDWLDVRDKKTTKEVNNDHVTRKDDDVTIRIKDTKIDDWGEKPVRNYENKYKDVMEKVYDYHYQKKRRPGLWNVGYGFGRTPIPFIGKRGIYAEQ